MDGQNSISIAVLSENQDDVELINSTLRAAGHAAHCIWISQPAKLEDTLQSAPIELLILNCDRYGDSVRQVVKQKERYSPEIPVIAMKEQADEAAIQDAMRSGAVDLVSIGLKKRLTAVVSRELRAMRAERALNSTIQSATEYRRQIQDFMHSSRAAIALVQEGIVLEANATWLQLFKLAQADEICGLPLMDSFDSDNHAALKGALIATEQGKWQPGEKLEAKPHTDGNESAPLMLEFRKVDFDGAPSVQIRITPPDRASQEPTKLVHDALKRDPTTLFFHRAQFLERIKKRLGRKPKSGLHVLAYVKIDHFVELRNKVGVINSEELLALFAELVRKQMHPRDVAGRFEGTSIMVLLERGSAHDGQVWGQQLVNKIQDTTFDVEDKSTQMTCTVGVCGVSDVFSSLEELLVATIGAHEAGKTQGGNTSILSEAADEDTKQREFDAIWVRHLKAALMENRFRLAQLPIAGLRSESVEMFDLLVRMIDEQGNSVLPSEFLPAAERNHMMKNIDRWMIKAATDFCANNNADRVFVRLSRESLLDASTAAWLQHELDQAQFDCSRLVAQVPERDAAKHIKQTRALVSKLKKIGVGFAIEHYGIDQDRFQILDILKPDYIKIDGELMHLLMSDSVMQTRMRKVVKAATDRGIKTIAERVENANAMAVLFQLGLDFMQGHYVHEPEVVLEDVENKPQRNSLSDLAAVSQN